MARITKIAADSFTPSLNARIQDFMSSRLYLKLREYFKPDTRSLIKHWMRKGLGQKYDELMNVNRDQKLQVTRDMWGLQNTKNKLGNVKFARKFDYSPEVSFRDGVQMTIEWLKFLGI
jgi:hypothetical protein